MVDPGDAPALLFDQCCFCPGKKLLKRAGSLKDRGFRPRPDPPYPTHMKIVVTQGRLMCDACRHRWSRPPLVPANPPSRRKKAAAASTSAAPPPKKPRTVAQSLNDANTALKKKYKAMTDKTEAAEEMFTQQVTAKEYAHVLRTREYKKILDEAGQVDFIPHVLEAVCEGHIPPDHIWYKYNRFAWHNCTLSCMCARMPACIHAGMHASAFDSARRL